MGKTEVCIDDEIPFELPDGWAWTRVCDIVEIFTGASFKKEESTKNPHGIRVLRGGNIVPGQFFFKDDDIFIDSSLVKQDILLRTNDLITPAVSSIENIGKVARIDKKIQNTTAGGFVFIIRPIVDDDIFSQYLSIAFSNPYMVNSIKGITKKSGQAFYNIGKERLVKLLIPVAPQREQNKIVERLKEFEPFLYNYQALETNEREMYEQLPVMLRKSILQYAIQGKLVPQDPTDEPASVLLERIRSEREKANGGKKSKAKTESYIFKNSDDNSYYEKIGEKVVCIDEEIPFELPNGWAWTRLGNIGYWGAGATPLRSNGDYYGGKIPWLKTGELNGGIVYGTQEHITEKALKECSLRLCEPGDVLIAMYGATIGKLAIAGVPMTTNQACCACTVHQGISNLYLFRYLEAIKPALIEQGAGGAQPNISREKIVNTLIPLPPTKEQQRICNSLDKILEIASQ